MGKRRSLRWLWLLVIGGVILAWHGLALADPAQQTSSARPPTIVDFHANLASIPLVDAEAGTIQATLSWQALYLGDAYRLRLESYVLRAWLPLVGEETLLSAAQDFPLFVQHPLNFGPPTYRLSIINAAGDVLDQRTVVIPYEDSAAAVQPTISGFSADPAPLDAAALAAGSARVTVSWGVVNRLPGSHIVFEQVVAPGITVPVDLPRESLWVPSSGQGTLAPVLPQDGTTTVRLRLNLVSLYDDTLYDQREITVGAGVSESTPPPADVPPGATAVAAALTLDASPTATATPEGGVEIRFFRAEPAQLDPGGTVKLHWSVYGVQQVDIQQINPGAQPGPLYAALPAEGTLDVAVPETYLYRLWFDLLVQAMRGPLTQRVEVQLNCDPFFFGDPANGTCPFAPPEPRRAELQAFEGGYMLWINDPDYLDVVHVLYNDGRSARYVDEWVEGMDSAAARLNEAPPPGRYTPVRGFGKIWIDQPAVRSGLGWATTPPQPYTAQFQRVAVYVGARLVGADYYLTLPGARLIYIYGGGWSAPTNWTFMTP